MIADWRVARQDNTIANIVFFKGNWDDKNLEHETKSKSNVYINDTVVEKAKRETYIIHSNHGVLFCSVQFCDPTLLVANEFKHDIHAGYFEKEILHESLE